MERIDPTERLLRETPVPLARGRRAPRATQRAIAGTPRNPHSPGGKG